MFEEKTFENILSDMLSYVADRNPDLDVREGSIIYTALAPMALELETAYHEMDMIMNETFLETASMEYLVKHGDQMGVALHEATYAHFEGEFDAEVEIGSRFNLDEFNYAVIDKLSDPTEDNPHYRFELVCETAGAEPNTYLGALTPITFVENLSYAELTSVLIYGEDEEDTEAYRYRLQIHAKNPPVNGNIAQYNEWLDNYDGVGKYRVTPLWNGANTIKLTVLDSNDEAASDELIDELQEYFDPGSRGMGDGQAPIGAIVTVDTAIEVPVVIDCELALKDDYTSPIGVQEGIIEYLKSVALNKNFVAYMPISAAIYNAESVDDIRRLSVEVKDITMDADISTFIPSVSLGANEIPVLDVENSVWGE